MREEFYKAYEDLYFEYVDEQYLIRRRPYLLSKEYYKIIIIKIRISIEEADKENKLRPDAKYFLLVNFDHLIVRPLFERRPYQKGFYEIEKAIEADISTIFSTAKQEPEQDEISGHKIMNTINKLWKDLKTTRLELWG
jgi:hypothetical protein